MVIFVTDAPGHCKVVDRLHPGVTAEVIVF